MKKILNSILIIFIGLFVIVLTGCSKEDSSTTTDTGSDTVVDKASSTIKSTDDLANKSGILTCTREGTASGDLVPSFSYVITYREGELLTLRAIEKVSSPTGTGLGAYYDAYLAINKNYEGLDYYTSNVTKTDTSVTRDTLIDYEHIDTDKLLHIEGNEDNIIDDNGKASLDMWLTLANKFGTKCDESLG